MKKMICFLLLPALLLLSACGQAPKAVVSSDTLYVKAVPGLAKDFILGMDVSSVLAEEASGVFGEDNAVAVAVAISCASCDGTGVSVSAAAVIVGTSASGARSIYYCAGRGL